MLELSALLGTSVGAFLFLSISAVLAYFFNNSKNTPKLGFSESYDKREMRLIEAKVIETEVEQKMCLAFLDDKNLTKIKRTYEYILDTNEKLSSPMVSVSISKKSDKLTKQATEIIKKTGELYHLKDGILLGTVELEDGESEFVNYAELTLDKLEHLKEAIMLLLQSTSDKIIDDLAGIDIDKSISGSKALIRFNQVLYRGKTLLETMPKTEPQTQEFFNVSTIVNKRMDELYDAYLGAFLHDNVNSLLAQNAFNVSLDAIEDYLSRIEVGANSDAKLAMDELTINVRYIESITQNALDV